MQAVIEALEQKGVQRNAVLQLIREKQEQYHNLLTQEAAARLIGREKGLALQAAPKQLTPLVNLTQGDRVSNVFKITYFTEPRRFSREKREGLVTTLALKGGEKECTLTLWDRDCKALLASDLSINDVIIVSDAVVKNVNPLELNADLLTKIEASNANCDFPNRELKTASIDKLVPSEELVTLSGVISATGSLKTFKREKGEGKLLRLTIAQNNASAPLVCWGEYAEIAKNTEVGTVINLFDVKVKQNKLNSLAEVHTTNSTRIVLNGKKEDQNNAKRQMIETLKDGDTGIISGSVAGLKEVKVVKLCDKCFSTTKSETCHCGGKANDTIIAEATICDNSGSIMCSFFDSRALHLLEMKSIAPDICQTVCELKREKIKGKPVTLEVSAKFNNYLNALTAKCRQIL